jgi:hypothetical protein
MFVVGPVVCNDPVASRDRVAYDAEAWPIGRCSTTTTHCSGG